MNMFNNLKPIFSNGLFPKFYILNNSASMMNRQYHNDKNEKQPRCHYDFDYHVICFLDFLKAAITILEPSVLYLISLH